MTLIVFFTIIVINLFWAYCKQNSKIVFWLSSVGIAILMCGYRRPFYGDLDNYSYMYEGQLDTTIGLNVIFSFAKKFGLTFWNTHYLLIIIMLLIVCFFIKKYTFNCHLPIACFTAYYIIISSDQVKNHTAFIFLILAIYALYCEYKKIAVVFIIIASSIHYSFIVYLMLLVVCDEKKKDITRTILISSFILTFLEIIGIGDLILFLVSKMGGIVEQYLGTYALSKLQNYTDNRTRFGYFILFGFQIMEFYLLKLSYKWMPKNNKTVIAEKFCIFIKNINLLGFMFFPLFVYNQQWYRLIRELLIFNYCVYGNTYYLLPRNSSKRFFMFLAIIFGVSVWLVGDLCIKTEMSGVLIPFFTNNLYLN